MINTLTLNPAIDKILYLDTVEKSMTNRVSDTTKTVGGKGTHVSMNLSEMGIDSKAFGSVYGDTGRFILNTLQQWGVITRFVFHDRLESRTNYILIENDNTCTMIAEKGPALSEEDLRKVIETMKSEIVNGEFLVLSGDASNCANPFIYNQIIEELNDKQLRIFLDSSGETLLKGLECSPFLVKPNQSELETLCGFTFTDDEDVIRGIKSLDSYNIEVVAVSLGKNGAIVRFGKEYYMAKPPEVNARNTAGCGDSFLAALLYGYEKGMTHPEMLKYATAVSSAAAASVLSVGYDKALAAALLEKSIVERII